MAKKQPETIVEGPGITQREARSALTAIAVGNSVNVTVSAQILAIGDGMAQLRVESMLLVRAVKDLS